MASRPEAVRPRLIVSKCLGFEACRYDGSILSDRFIERLREHVEFLQVCPEVGMGLGVPREPVGLVGAVRAPRMIQTASGVDLTERMVSFSEGFLRGLPEIDGALMKSRSPSCGKGDVPVHGPHGSADRTRTGWGLFSAAVARCHRDIPVESEARLLDSGTREHFLARVFASARFRAAAASCRASRRKGPLVDFHSAMKLQLMTMDREAERRLGRLVASSAPVHGLLEEYRAGLHEAMSRPPRTGATVDALLHALGFFDGKPSEAGRAGFLESVEGFRTGRLPLSACLSILREWLARWRSDWLAAQFFLAPYPDGLSDLSDRDRGQASSAPAVRRVDRRSG